MSQVDTENDEGPKFSNFQSFHAFFPKFLTYFVDWTISKGQQGKNVLSSMLREQIKTVFQMKKVWN